MTFLLVVHTLLALALVGVILMQKSEGGGFTGGSTGGLVSARGAADLLTRTTSIVATLFIATSLILAWLAGHSNRPKTIDTSLAREAPANVPPATPATAPAPGGAPAAPQQAPAGVPVAN